MMRGSYGSERQSGRQWTWTIVVGSVAIAFTAAAGLVWSETRAETGPGLGTDTQAAA
jgi:type IV secretory pathway TrbF-like protein